MKEAGSRQRQVFDEVCEHLTPAFRYFFLERFPQPQLWFARRTSYVRSVAVSSIVGYILGIGDRHAYNILLDKTTAEVVHIDFGITFEQGKVLTTPETVPFRLTRDIVDGMGVTGTEGTFRRCCERVLTVLKKHATTISTILEVIIHDPMFRWLLSPVEIRRRQQQEGEELFVGTNVSDSVADQRENGSRKESRASADAAERALLRVKQKLQGYEDPSGVPLGVQGHVNLLINMAQDPDNLCRVFSGWAPWL
jgi:ataxia telangiectasia mutated family protein